MHLQFDIETVRQVLIAASPTEAIDRYIAPASNTNNVHGRTGTVNKLPTRYQLSKVGTVLWSIHGMATALVSDERIMLTFFPGWPDLPKTFVFSNLNPFYFMCCILPPFDFIFHAYLTSFLKIC